MSKDIQQLLQECLQGFDAGLTPDECLSAYPQVRTQLEPLFRQALSLRVAYAASPRPEFRLQAREKLLFAAGRDVKQALSAEPDPQFVDTTRQRLLNTAGAAAQEALRDVPPPRLPFWVNARRRLLETASVSPPRPAPQLAMVMRTALSAAVIVLAVAVAGAGFLLENSPANEPLRSALGEEIDYITNQVTTFEQQRAAGEPVSSTLLDDLAERTSQLAEQAASDNANADLIEKLPGLIDRQRTLLTEAAPPDASAAAAQANLAAADQRVAAASTTVPEPTGTNATTAITSPTPEATVVESSPEPTATPETTEQPAGAAVEQDDLAERELVVRSDPDETMLGLSWQRVTTRTLTFVMPDSWTLFNVTLDEDGHAVLPSDYLFIMTNVDGLGLVIRIANGEVGEVNSIDPQFNLRAGGPEGSVAAPETLSGLTGGDENIAGLFIMLNSIEVTELDAEPSATPEFTETP
jgi:hypothetical protein